MTKREKQVLLNKIKKCKDNIAKERDQLRELVEDAQLIAETADDAIVNIEAGIDGLSQYL